MDIKKKVGLRIRELRHQSKLSQETLANKADVENGRRNISIVIFEKIIAALEISFTDFFNSKVFKK